MLLGDSVLTMSREGNKPLISLAIAFCILGISGAPISVSSSVCKLSACDINNEFQEHLEAFSDRLATIPDQEKMIQHLRIRLTDMEKKYGTSNTDKTPLEQQIERLKAGMKREKNKTLAILRDLDQCKRTTEDVRKKMATITPYFDIPETSRNSSSVESGTNRRSGLSKLVLTAVQEATKQFTEEMTSKMNKMERQMLSTKDENQTEILMAKLENHTRLREMTTDAKIKKRLEAFARNLNDTETNMVETMDTLRTKIDYLGHSLAEINNSRAAHSTTNQSFSHVQGLLEQYGKDLQRLNKILQIIVNKQGLILDEFLLQACYHLTPAPSNVTSEYEGKVLTFSQMLSSSSEVIYRCTNSAWRMTGSPIRRCWNGTWSTPSPPTCSPSTTIGILTPPPSADLTTTINPCPPSKVGNVQDPSDCRKFYQCRDGENLQVLACPDTTYYNATYDRCERITNKALDLCS